VSEIVEVGAATVAPPHDVVEFATASWRAASSAAWPGA
jgi:hypothetical protein